MTSQAHSTLASYGMKLLRQQPGTATWHVHRFKAGAVRLVLEEGKTVVAGMGAGGGSASWPGGGCVSGFGTPVPPVLADSLPGALRRSAHLCHTCHQCVRRRPGLDSGGSSLLRTARGSCCSIASSSPRS